MDSRIEISDKDKFELLKTLLIENRKELVFWSERSWKFTSWLIGGVMTSSGLSFYVRNVYKADTLPFSFVILGLAIVGTIYLGKNYVTYRHRFRYRKRIEKALRFFEEEAYIANEPLLTLEFEKTDPTWLGTVAFIATLWIIAIPTIIAITLL